MQPQPNVKTSAFAPKAGDITAVHSHIIELQRFHTFFGLVTRQALTLDERYSALRVQVSEQEADVAAAGAELDDGRFARVRQHNGSEGKERFHLRALADAWRC